jgi:hypothetical protein
LCDEGGAGSNWASKKSVVRHVSLLYGIKYRGNVHKEWKRRHELPFEPETNSEIAKLVDAILENYIDEVAFYIRHLLPPTTY